MDRQQPYGREDLMKIIDKYLKKIGKIPKYNQQSDEYSKKISEIIENLNRFELKYRLRDHVKDLKELLNEMHKFVKEKTGIFEIKKSTVVIDSDCKKISDDLIFCESHIKMNLYNEDEEFMCLLDTQRSSDHIECTHYDDKRFIYSRKINSLIRSIEEKILDIYKILYPEVSKYHINTDISMYLGKPKKVIPEMSINDNSVIYDEGIFYMKVTLQ
jgi:hypothetical protein